MLFFRAGMSLMLVTITMTPAYLIPKRIERGAQGTPAFQKLMDTRILMRYAPQMLPSINPDKPLRKSMVAPGDTGSFVKPVKQCFIKNPRLSPMTRLMLTLLYGWAGKGQAVETTTGALGKHLSRCRRTIYSLLKDAAEEGYLTYVRTKCRLGKYTGIKIFLNFEAIGFTGFAKKQKTAENSPFIHEQLPAEINTKHIYNHKDDGEIWDKLTRLALSAGYIDTKDPST